MTIDEAIEILGQDVETLEYSSYARFAEAQALGIEALKRLKEHREDHIDITFGPGPGKGSYGP